MTVLIQVLDVTHGCPAGGVPVRLEQRTGRSWTPYAIVTTDDRGRAEVGAPGLAHGWSIRIVIDTQKFFAALGVSSSLQAEVSTVMRPADPGTVRRVSILLAPFSFTICSVEHPS